VVVKCEDVWREISNYFGGDIDPAFKHSLEQHFMQCPHCQSVRDGVSNVIKLYGDKTMLPLPAGFDARLQDRLADQVNGRKISRRAWLVSAGVTGALAASALLAATLDRFAPQPRAKMSQPARRLPERLVAVVDGGKVFHVPGCPFMHGKYHMVTAEEAVREGYVPCNRCMYEALRSAGKLTPDVEGEEIVRNEKPVNDGNPGG
jgi:Putative zinc-finger